MVVLRVLVDDYAEVWVDGQMPRDSVKAGDRFQVAIFGINGPISVAPLNTVWFREAKIEFYK